MSEKSTSRITVLKEKLGAFIKLFKNKKIWIPSLSLLLVAALTVSLFAFGWRKALPVTNGSADTSQTGSTVPGDTTSQTDGDMTDTTEGTDTTDGPTVIVPEEDPVFSGNLAAGRRYQYSFPGLRGFSGDPDNNVLTDNDISADDVGGSGWLLSKIANEDYETTNSKGDTVYLSTWSTVRDPNFSITIDLGYICDISSVTVTFGKNSDKKITFPKSMDIFLSNDGYNFTIYPEQKPGSKTSGDILTCKVTFPSPQKAKAVKIVVYAPTNSTTAISEIAVNGTSYRKNVLISEGASYTIEGDSVEGFEDDGVKLTNGKFVYYDDTSDCVGIQDSEYEEMTSSFCAFVNIDLGAVKNLSEIRMEALVMPGTSDEPKYIAALYSADGKKYTDFGTSAVVNVYGEKTAFKSAFVITRNHTVFARYVRVKIYGGEIKASTMLIDEIACYGTDKPVSEPGYKYATKKSNLAHTNVLELRKLKVDGSETDVLTDLIYMNEDYSITKSKGKTVIEATLDKTYSEINSTALYFRTASPYKKPASVKTSVSSGNGKFTQVAAEFTSHQVAGRTVVRQLFGKKTAKVIRIEIESDSPYQLLEVAAYNAQPQLPVIDGGFVTPQFYISSKSEGISRLDDYMWYIMLKGMKEMGMDYAVVAHTTSKRSNLTLIQNNKELKARGYSYLKNQNSRDPIEALMDAADRLDMKIFMGTALGESYLNVPNDAYHDEVINDAKITIKALADNYGSHKSFYGYYFSDETCDEWLAQSGGVATFRKLYKSQSDYIRKNYPGKKTMICPAIWRSGTPSAGRQNLYNLLKGDKAGDPPIVDIVAAQDCLGRSNYLVLPDDTFEAYERYLEAWARGVREAGAEFWNDIEIFYSGGRVTKNIPDIINALEIESKYTNGNIVFDIVNYFSPICQTAKINSDYRGVYNWEYAYQEYHVLQYVKYYQTKYAAANRWGLNAASGDGTSVKIPKVPIVSSGLEPPEVSPPVDTGKPLAGTGILRAPVTPSMGYPIATSQWGEFQNFKNSSVQYAMVYDDVFLYIGIKTNDSTENLGTLAKWWEAKADMVQIFLSGKGDLAPTLADLSALEHALRISFTRTKPDAYETGVHLKGTKSPGSGIHVATVLNKGKPEIIIAISWKYALGMDAPKKGDAVAIKIIYYDALPDGTVSYANTASKSSDLGSDAIFYIQ